MADDSDRVDTVAVAEKCRSDLQRDDISVYLTGKMINSIHPHVKLGRSSHF